MALKFSENPVNMLMMRIVVSGDNLFVNKDLGGISTILKVAITFSLLFYH